MGLKRTRGRPVVEKISRRAIRCALDGITWKA